jgi:hypothetical protein
MRGVSLFMDENFERQTEDLKTIRNKFLRLHKILLDDARVEYEREFGPVSAGKFLELLLGDERFEWLRTISTLIVRIDEAFDLDDGMSNDLLEGFFRESGDLFDFGSAEYTVFKEKLHKALPKLPEASRLKDEISELAEGKSV